MDAPKKLGTFYGYGVCVEQPDGTLHWVKTTPKWAWFHCDVSAYPWTENAALAKLEGRPDEGWLLESDDPKNPKEVQTPSGVIPAKRVKVKMVVSIVEDPLPDERRWWREDAIRQG